MEVAGMFVSASATCRPRPATRRLPAPCPRRGGPDASDPAHRVDDRPAGDAAHDARPGLAGVARAEDVRAQVVEAERVDGRARAVAIDVDASISETFAHGESSVGVTFDHVRPPSLVTWIRPSSVPTHSR